MLNPLRSFTEIQIFCFQLPVKVAQAFVPRLGMTLLLRRFYHFFCSTISIKHFTVNLIYLSWLHLINFHFEGGGGEQQVVMSRPKLFAYELGSSGDELFLLTLSKSTFFYACDVRIFLMKMMRSIYFVLLIMN